MASEQERRESIKRLGKAFSGLGKVSGQEVAAPDETVVIQQAPIVTLKPEEQEILDNRILWTWNQPNVDEGWLIWAIYFTKDHETANHDKFKAGEYVIKIEFRADSIELRFGAQAAQDFAVALLSASRWESAWQRHVGEYLAVRPSEPPADVLRVLNDE